MKRTLLIILLVSMMLLLLFACSSMREGINMPDIKTSLAFENDEWLVIEDCLVNKNDGTAHWLELNRDIPIPEVTQFYSDSANIYKYEFEESSIRQYTFLSVYLESYYEYYYEYIITFNYDGKEIERSRISDLLTRTQMKKAFQAKVKDANSFCFCLFREGDGYIYDRFGKVDKESVDTNGQIVLEFAKNLHMDQSNDDSRSIKGIARTVGDELWFSTAGSNLSDSVHADPLIKGIRETKITSYDFETKEFKTVFEHNKKASQIIDFDENGAYVLDSSGTFGYVDFKTQKQTVIYELPNVDCIILTDQYICIKYINNGHSYLVYEKGNSVVANDSTLD